MEDANTAAESSTAAPATTTSETTGGMFATSQIQEPQGQAQESATAQAEGTQEDDLSNLPFHEHPRFQQLIQENRDLKEFKGKYGGYVPMLDKFSEAGLADFDAIEARKQEVFNQQQAAQQQREADARLEQEISADLDAYRTELEEEGLSQERIERALEDRKNRLVFEAVQEITASSQQNDAQSAAMTAAQQALSVVPEDQRAGFLEIAGMFDPQTVPIVTERIATLVLSIRQQAIVEYEAERARTGAPIPANGSGNTNEAALTPNYTPHSGGLGAALRNQTSWGRV